MTSLTDLYNRSQQSPWIDNLSRSWLTSGRIEELKAQGIRGLTSNPTIFANAISKSDDYDKEFFDLIKEMDVKTAYWQMSTEDVAAAADILHAVYLDSNRSDGFVSIEVDPELAHDTSGTIDAAQWLWDTVSRENLMIKIPGTIEGLPAITEVLSRGISVNVTLIFGLERYAKVMDAHIEGIKRAKDNGHPLETISSVASFFVSRVDTKLDPILETFGDRGKALLGRVAVAQAQAAYVMNTERYSSREFSDLAELGARLQRPLWASTSTKNPNYSDLLYVENLIAPNTVNTMPEATVLAFLDHGATDDISNTFRRESTEVINSLEELRVDLVKVSEELEKEGVDSFADSFRDLLAALESKKQLGR